MSTGDYYECPTCSYATTVKLCDLVALPFGVKFHTDSGHKLSQPTPAGFVICSCGISFRVGVIVDKSILV